MTALNLKPVDIDTDMVTAANAATAAITTVNATAAVTTNAAELLASDAPWSPRRTADMNANTATSVNTPAMPDLSGSAEPHGEHA
jgi:hypothetical protein